jgi:hypothetical protein
MLNDNNVDNIHRCLSWRIAVDLLTIASFPRSRRSALALLTYPIASPAIEAAGRGAGGRGRRRGMAGGDRAWMLDFFLKPLISYAPFLGGASAAPEVASGFPSRKHDRNPYDTGISFISLKPRADATDAT